MKVPYISNSRLEVYSNCPMKYYFMYELGLKTKTHPAAALGSALHKALEMYISKGDDLYKAFDDAFKESQLNTQEWYNEGKTILKHLEGRGIRDEGSQTICTEKGFDITFPNEVRIFGYIDRVDKIDDKTIEIIDYKSTKYPYTQEQIDNDIQVGIYSLAVKENLYPEYPLVLVTFDFIRYGRMSTLRTQAQLEGLKEYLKMMRDKISNDNLPVGNVTSKCKWCDFKETCPDYKKKIDSILSEQDNIYGKTDEQLAQELCYSELKADYWDSHVTKLKEHFKNKFIENEQTSLKTKEGSLVYIRSRQLKTVYDDGVIRELLNERNIPLDTVMEFNKKKIDEILSDGPAQEKLKKTAKIYYSEPTIKTRVDMNDK